MKPKFTPGPWQVFVEGNDVFVDPWICEKTCQNEAEKESAIANAALIAAAPEMYEALMSVVRECYTEGYYHAFRWADTRDKVFSVLKKARGEE